MNQSLTPSVLRPRRRSLRLVPALLAATLIASACTTGDDATNGSGFGQSNPDTTNLVGSDIVLTAGLETLDSCDALLERIKDEAIERVGPYGFGDGFHGPIFAEADVGGLDDEEAATESSASDDRASFAQAAPSSNLAAAEGADGAGSGSFSETNNQEQDVDEADLVKTDGERVVIVSGNTLRVIDAAADTPQLTRTIELPEDSWGGQLFLDGDRALLMTSGWTNRPFIEQSIATDWYQGSPIGRLIEIDLVNGQVTRTLEFEGGYLSAREIGGTIRIVLTASADRFAFVYPSNDNATEAATVANQSVIESSTIEHWIPTYRITEGGSTVAEGPIVDCDRVHIPSEFAGFGSLVVLTADLDDGLAINDALSVFTNAQTVYASTDRVAVATPRWPRFDGDGEPDNEEFSTALHTFDITNADRADYVATGSVRGHLLNQFSLSEHEGYLRVATTEGSPWGGADETSESFVTVLAEEGNALQPVGEVGGLGEGEQIFAVRFLGDTGYVVTFRQVDPLYTVDLSDPTNPQVVGELKIPGFSSYLHPVGEDHLIGVGTDGDDEGRTEGAVISLFDVSDPADPQRVDKLNLDGANGSFDSNDQSSSATPVSWDAKAFTYWEDTAIVPISWWSYNQADGTSDNGSAAVLVEVNVDGQASLNETGRVPHPEVTFCEGEDGVTIIQEDDEPATSESTDAEASFVDDNDEPASTSPVPGRYCESWTPEIQRSVVVGDNLFTISEGGVKVVTFNGLNRVNWIPFEQR